MEALLFSASRALRSLVAPGMPRIFFYSVVTTLAALIGFVMVSHALFNWMAAPDSALAWVGTFGAGLVAWLLFPGIMPIIVNFFDAHIAELIERQDYPNAPLARPSAFWAEFWHDARFSLLAVTLNILALPLYLLPVVNVFLFYLLNGYLLGREFFTMAARRHLTLEETRALRKRHSLTVTAAGVMLTVLATIPLINLFAPFWGVAVMVHLYNRLTPIPA